MKFGCKITALACASALALAGAVPAFAADGTTSVTKDGDSADIEISAAVAKEGEHIISVTVPSQMAIAITTNKTDGKFKSYKSAPATITNNEMSTSAVKVEVAKVSQIAGQDSHGKLLDLVNLKLSGDSENTVTLAEDTAGATLVASMGVKGSYSLQLSAEALATDPVIPTDAYTVNTTLKVTALDALPTA